MSDTIDLGSGIALSEIGDHAKIAGRVGENDVVLIRRGDDFFALDAFCTHYHGPLAEGLVVGDTLRCPWHHACFDLRTGSALGAPAMRPLRVYTTVCDGDRIRVLPGPEHVVIVGAGAAGSFAAAELRRIGFEGRVTLLTREDRVPYDRPNLSKDYLAGRAQPEWMPLREEADYARERIDLRLGADVEAIEGQEIRLASGERIAFDRLILATGARPRHLDFPNVHYLRSWNDADALIHAADGKHRAVIIGASFIGLETAASLRERGLDVTVVGVEQLPLERVLGTAVAQFIQRLHEQHGVRFRLGRRPVEIRADAVVLDDGSVETCDLAVAGIGVEPELAIAANAGLTIDRGVVVDEYLQTSTPNVFAAGDIARYPYRGRAIRIEHWAAAARQGQAAARNAIGRREPFTDVPFFWSQHYDLVFAYVGHAESADDAQLFGSLDEHNAAVVYRDAGRIAAVVTLFRDDVSLAVEAAMQRDATDAELETIVREAFT